MNVSTVPLPVPHLFGLGLLDRGLLDGVNIRPPTVRQALVAVTEVARRLEEMDHRAGFIALFIGAPLLGRSGALGQRELLSRG